VHKLLPSLTVAGLLALSLAACSTPAAPGCDATPSGDASSKVTVTGAADAEPTVTIPSPHDTKETQRTVVTEGDGEVVEPGMYVTTNFVLYNGATGEKIDGSKDFSSSGEFPFVVDDGRILSGIAKIVQCSTVGSRVVGVVPPADAFGADGPNFGIGATDSLVFVFDIKKVEASEPSAEPTAPAELPTPSEWTENLPTVDLSADVPVVTLPDVEIPAGLELKVLEAGDGDPVTAASTVTFDYQGTSWNTGEIFDQSYTRGEPITYPVTQLVQGFTAAMVGQNVGATLLVTVPPQYGYGEGEINDQNLVGQTLVFLIQIRSVS
jgi:peptidylprolyl isomerase